MSSSLILKSGKRRIIALEAGDSSSEDDSFLSIMACLNDARALVVDISVTCTAPEGPLGVLHHTTTRMATEDSLAEVIGAVLSERRQVIIAMEADAPGPFQFADGKWDYILPPPECIDPRLKQRPSS